MNNDFKACRYCDEKIHSTALVCEFCGEDVAEAEKVVCPHCNELTPKNSDECEICAEKLTQEIAEKKPESTQSKNLVKCPYCNEDTDANIAECQICAEAISKKPVPKVIPKKNSPKEPVKKISTSPSPGTSVHFKKEEEKSNLVKTSVIVLISIIIAGALLIVGSELISSKKETNIAEVPKEAKQEVKQETKKEEIKKTTKPVKKVQKAATLPKTKKQEAVKKPTAKVATKTVSKPLQKQQKPSKKVAAKPTEVKKEIVKAKAPETPAPKKEEEKKDNIKLVSDIKEPVVKKAESKPKVNPLPAVLTLKNIPDNQLLKYVDYLRKEIARRWNIRSISGSGYVILQFKLDSNGKTISRALTGGSKNRSLDDSVLRAFDSVGKFHYAPPKNYQSQSIQFRFDFNNGRYSIY